MGGGYIYVLDFFGACFVSQRMAGYNRNPRTPSGSIV